ncbi:MAG: NADH-quinone oxidoreductase subunit C [Syntrophothermus sp.]|uniref:NADH-quinone oxidoreductase subunit C n=1 Tax=Syntrophothermus sp. TaxID=2736299 RepID=UPI00257D4BEF|nr:NADH-quinone oxidoreductase subunit C [Syntrophothermus sp.]NSW81695.1 NADH-quinone oxidoreductase subunit C [Syntrophothermus sp.]
MKVLKEVVEDISQVFGDQVLIEEGAGFTVIRVICPQVLSFMRRLKEIHGFNYLANLTAVDYRDRFELVYHVYAVPENRGLVVKTSVSREEPVVPSVVSVWPAADWQEREVFDLLGISFEGHPNLRRILLPEGFEGHPLRKDFPAER